MFILIVNNVAYIFCQILAYFLYVYDIDKHYAKIIANKNDRYKYDYI